jgi:hypothetical protein
MSNGDDEPADDAVADDDAATDAPDATAPALPDEATEESLTDYLAEIEAVLEDAETEPALDDVDALLDDAADAVADADLPEPDEDDEDADDPRDELETAIESIRTDVEAVRGPYAADVVASIDTAVETLDDTEWTAAGRTDAATAVETFLADATTALDTDLVDTTAAADAVATADTEDAEPADVVAGLTAALDTAAEAVTDAGLDPDDDAATIAAFVDAAADLETALDDAEEWDDLETHEQLRAQGYYDVLGHYKDFPVEWAALKEHETRGNVDMILLALDALGSEFMEDHCLESLERMGKRGKTPESVEELLGRAGKRDETAIRILGKMAATEAVDTLVEYVDEDSNPQLQKATFRALGEIGSTDAVAPLAAKLTMDDDYVRPYAARALGMIGDTRAVDPLAEALATDPDDDVRAAAGWALRQIGTRDALEAAAEYVDEHSFVVQTEAEKAQATLDATAQTA